MALATKDQGINWLIRLIMAVLVVVLSFVIVKTVITFANPESAWKQPAITPAVSQNIAARGVQNFSFRTDPFNREVAAAPELLAEVGQDAPETTLNLKLTGRTTAKTSGTVIILTPDNKTGNYRVGDEIVPGVILKAVNKDFVVLDVDGQIQRLTFERGEDTSLIKRTALDEDAPKTTIQVKAPNGSASAPFPSEAISGDVSTLFQNISLRRVMKDGRLTGYSVKPNRPGVNLAPLGFSKGDIITAIGDTDITRGRPDFIALFEKAAQSGGTEVTVLRNGQVKIIKLGTP